MQQPAVHIRVPRTHGLAPAMPPVTRTDQVRRFNDPDSLDFSTDLSDRS
jgi:hypothetical protein